MSGSQSMISKVLGDSCKQKIAASILLLLKNTPQGMGDLEDKLDLLKET